MDENQCYHLPIKMEEAPNFDEIFRMQANLQVRVDPDFFNILCLADLVKKIQDQQIASREEEVEFLNALGGTHDQGPRSAVWKWWKAENKTTARNMSFLNLSQRDQMEAKMELVDRFHFLMNEALLIGMTGSEFYSMYKSKNAENFNRQDNGY